MYKYLEFYVIIFAKVNVVNIGGD